MLLKSVLAVALAAQVAQKVQAGTRVQKQAVINPQFCKTKADAQMHDKVMLIRSDVSTSGDTLKLTVSAEGVTCVEQSGRVKWIKDSTFSGYTYDASKFGAQGVTVEVINQELAVVVLDIESGFSVEKKVTQNRSTSLSEEFELNINKMLTDNEQDKLKAGQKIFRDLEVFIRARQDISASNGIKDSKNQTWTQLLRIEIERGESGALNSRLLN